MISASKRERCTRVFKERIGEERWQRVARFRLGIEMKGEKYWEEEEEKKCKMCNLEEENWRHVWEECTESGVEKSCNDMVEIILGE